MPPLNKKQKQNHESRRSCFLTVVVGVHGSKFAPPFRGHNGDDDPDPSKLSSVPDLYFTVHHFFVTAAVELVLERHRNNLKTTIFVWITQLELLHNVLHISKIVFQDDMCRVNSCLNVATAQYRRDDRTWVPLCKKCEAEVRLRLTMRANASQSFKKSGTPERPV